MAVPGSPLSSERVASSRDRALLALFEGGLNAAELCALRLSDLELEEGLPRLRGRVLAPEAQRALHAWLKRRKLLTLDETGTVDREALWLNVAGCALGEAEVVACLQALEDCPTALPTARRQ